MDDLGAFGRWIAENEALLSGLVSLILLAGLVLSPLGKGIRRLFLGGKRAPAEPGPPPSATVSPGGDPLLAVLAFDNLSSDAEMQFFSDGISEEIIQRLARGAKLRVIGRTSSFQLRGEQKAEAGRILDCSHVLDGSIRRSGARVRISAHLVEVASRTTLWSDRYERGLEDIFAVQDEISESIAGALDRAFSDTAAADVDPDVYDLYLRSSPASYAPDELRTQIGRLEEVTRRAPDFAEAWSRLVYLRGWWHFYQPFAERAAIAARVDQEADRALALDPRDLGALLARLFVAPPFGRFLEGDAALERARRAAGDDPRRSYIGWYLRTQGRVRESLEEAERAHRLDALNPMCANLLALARMAAGRLDEAVPLYEDLVERAPEMSFPVASLLRAHAFREDWAAVDHLLDLAAQRDLRELEGGLSFIRAKRDPSPERLAAWREQFGARAASTSRSWSTRRISASSKRRTGPPSRPGWAPWAAATT